MDSTRTRTGTFPIMIVVMLALTALRVYSGVRWFGETLWKVPWSGAGGFGCTDANRFNVPPGTKLEGMCDWLNKSATYPLIPLNGDFVRNVVMPNLGFFGWVIFLVELFIAISLITGFLSRIGGTIGFLMASFIILNIANVPGEDLTYFIPYIFPPLIIAIVGPKWHYGVDTLLMPFYRKLASRPGWVGNVARFALGVPGAEKVLTS